MVSATLKDKVSGCLIGGAVGDALGYAVEFMQWDYIQERYGKSGITAYDTGIRHVASISDDTQMTLFTANGLLVHDANSGKQYIDSIPEYVYRAYRDWLITQNHSHAETGDLYESDTSAHWLMSVKELFSPRAPGNTCMGALRSGMMGSIESPLNNSKGCGGVMRVAPVGLRYPDMPRDRLAMIGAEIGAITHGHPLGYIPCATLTDIVHECVYGEAWPLAEIINDSIELTKRIFSDEPYLPQFIDLIDRARELSAESGSDEEHIRFIGEGWVGDEALAIAIYCALRYPADFDKAIIASVNHSGDSDSTGAVLGNILGAYLGRGAIGAHWTKELELKNTIERMADMLVDD